MNQLNQRKKSIFIRDSVQSEKNVVRIVALKGVSSHYWTARVFYIYCCYVFTIIFNTLYFIKINVHAFCRPSNFPCRYALRNTIHWPNKSYIMETYQTNLTLQSPTLYRLDLPPKEKKQYRIACNFRVCQISRLALWIWVLNYCSLYAWCPFIRSPGNNCEISGFC